MFICLVISIFYTLGDTIVLAKHQGAQALPDMRIAPPFVHLPKSLSGTMLSWLN